MMFSPLGGGFGIGISLFQIMFFAVFTIVFAMIIYRIVSNIREWKSNNNSPILKVSAEVVTKRNEVHRHHHNNGTGAMHVSTSTSYFITFQVESGDRIELRVDGKEYGLIAEKDKGNLTFQGTRFLSFERTI